MKLSDELREQLFNYARGTEPVEPYRSELIQHRILNHRGVLTGYGRYTLVRNGWRGKLPTYQSMTRNPIPRGIRGCEHP